MPFEIIRNDITRMNTDAIVNAANSRLLEGGGVCGAIFRAAGSRQMTEACKRTGSCAVGEAVMTEGFNLPAKYVIHTVGPIWEGGANGEQQLLYSAYASSLSLAEKQGCKSIAFPLISSGIYGYPKREAMTVAVSAIRDYLKDHDMQVYLTVFDREALSAGEERFRSLRSYIDDHYVQEHFIARRSEAEVLAAPCAAMPKEAPKPKAKGKVLLGSSSRRSLSDLLDHMDDSFSKMLLDFIDRKGMTDVEVYKRANIDRKLFSKIRKDSYTPSKPTVLALAIALELNLDQTRDLLKRAGYALSSGNKFDVIIEYYISNGIYDIFEINEALFAFDQRLLGA